MSRMPAGLQGRQMDGWKFNRNYAGHVRTWLYNANARAHVCACLYILRMHVCMCMHDHACVDCLEVHTYGPPAMYVLAPPPSHTYVYACLQLPTEHQALLLNTHQSGEHTQQAKLW